MPSVVIESAYRGNPCELNRVREVCRVFALAGWKVDASHLWYTQFLSEAVDAERRLGIELGYEDLDAADLVVLLTPCPPESAAHRAWARAQANGTPCRTLHSSENPSRILDEIENGGYFLRNLSRKDKP